MHGKYVLTILQRHIAINYPVQNTPSFQRHIYVIVLANFQSSSGSLLLWVSLVGCTKIIVNVAIKPNSVAR